MKSNEDDGLIAHGKSMRGEANFTRGPHDAHVLGVPHALRTTAAMAVVTDSSRGNTRVSADPRLLVVLEAPDTPDARWCLDRYFRELAERFDTGFDPGQSNPAPEAQLVPPNGFFVVARLDGVPVGCGALKRKIGALGEVKRMWTDPAVRRRGVARTILSRLETIATELGLTKLQLETNRSLPEALSLYVGAGYSEVAPFNDEVYAHHWFEKKLLV